MNRHIREVHDNPDRKTIQHEHVGNKIVCPICRKDFTHPASLKKHIIRKHEVEDLQEKKIKPELVIGKPLKRQKHDAAKTSLEEIKECQ
jgi:hypothetical protein